MMSARLCLMNPSNKMEIKGGQGQTGAKEKEKKGMKV